MSEYKVTEEIIDYLQPLVGDCDEGVAWLRYIRNTEQQEATIKELKAQSNKFELEAEDLEAAHMWLDDMGAPRGNTENAIYSIQGRVMRLLESKTKELREALLEAAEHIDNIKVKDAHLTRVEIADKYRTIAEGVK